MKIQRKIKKINKIDKETKEVAKMFPDLLEDEKQIKKDIKSGEYKNYKSLEEILKQK